MSPVERAFLATPITSAGRGVIASPFQFTTDGSEALRIVCANAMPGVVIEVHARWLDSAGTIQATVWTMTPTSNRLPTSLDFPLGKGSMLNVTCFASGATPKIGQTFVMLQLIRGLTGATLMLGTLLQGYVTSTQQLAWPGSPVQTSIDSGGVIRSIVGTQPAAGVNFQEAAPTGARWELLELRANFVAAAGGANRIPLLRLSDGVNDQALLLTSGSAAPGTNTVWTWSVNLPPLTTGTASASQQAVPAPCTLLAGNFFASFVVNLAPGDQWTAPMYVVREWLEVN